MPNKKVYVGNCGRLEVIERARKCKRDGNEEPIDK